MDVQSDFHLHMITNTQIAEQHSIMKGGPVALHMALVPFSIFTSDFTALQDDFTDFEMSQIKQMSKPPYHLWTGLLPMWSEQDQPTALKSPGPEVMNFSC